MERILRDICWRKAIMAFVYSFIFCNEEKEVNLSLHSEKKEDFILSKVTVTQTTGVFFLKRVIHLEHVLILFLFLAFIQVSRAQHTSINNSNLKTDNSIISSSPEELRVWSIPPVAHKVVEQEEDTVILAPLGSYPTTANLTGTLRLAAKTNFLIDATTSLALGFELRISRKKTIDLSGGFRFHDTGKKMRFRHSFIQPEIRLWTSEAFNGHFFGLHGHYAIYNVGGLPTSIFSEAMNQYRFEGWLAGGGISYGYQWIIGNRWSLEATAGIGWTHLNYGKYPCHKCGHKISDESRNYFGPTKAGISLLYIIK